MHNAAFYAGSHMKDSASLMVYHSEISYGGVIFKVVKEDLKFVGLHRGTLPNNQKSKGTNNYKVGSLVTDVCKSVMEDWHPIGIYVHTYVHLCIHTYVRITYTYSYVVKFCSIKCGRSVYN